MGWAKLIYIVLAHVATCHLHACLYLITEALACVIQALHSYECNVGMISDGEISGNTWFWHVFGCLQTLTVLRQIMLTALHLMGCELHYRL